MSKNITLPPQCQRGGGRGDRPPPSRQKNENQFFQELDVPSPSLHLTLKNMEYLKFFSLTSVYITELSCYLNQSNCLSQASKTFNQFISNCQNSVYGTGRCNQ